MGILYGHKINIILIILLSTMGVPRPKEFSSDVMPHPKEFSTLKVRVIYLVNKISWDSSHDTPYFLPPTLCTHNIQQFLEKELCLILPFVHG